VQIPARIKWRSGHVDLRCPVCGRREHQTRLATARVAWQPNRVVIARCGDCGSVILSHVIPADDAYTGAHWDWDQYVEHTAAIEVIANTLARVEAPRGARLLDLGCGFGFGLDLGEQLWGWQGVGLDPSPAARMGAEELGIDIRPALLDDDFAPDAPFAVMLASEVLEHLPDPRAVLALARKHLDDDGVLVLTTPDAEAVRPDTPGTTLQAVLSVGHHEFLVSASSLRRMLEAIGFHAEVWASDATVYAVASPTAAGLRRVDRARTVPLTELARYCEARASTASRGSALAVGMRVRQVKFLAYADDFTAAHATLPALRRAILDRHGTDIDDPIAVAASSSAPSVCTAACYFAGIFARYVEQDPIRADAYFTAAAASGRRHYDAHGRYADPETARFEMEALGEQALLWATDDPDRARASLRALDKTAARAGSTTLAEQFHDRVDPLLPPRPSRADAARGTARRAAARARRSVRRPSPPTVTPEEEAPGRAD
jgi:SAM-dependent methyltransferase